MNLLARMISWIVPRATLQQLADYGGTGKPGYSAGKMDRFQKGRVGVAPNSENAIDGLNITRTRWQAWQLYRDNPFVRRAVNTLAAKVLGRGLKPQPQAILSDGKPFHEFRRMAVRLYHEFAAKADYRGLPGFGGQTMAGIERTAFLAALNSGETLYRSRVSQLNRFGLGVQLIDTSRLTEDQPAELTSGHIFWRGIEFDEDRRRVAYWLQDDVPDAPWAMGTQTAASRVRATEVGHLFLQSDIDQLRGAPWLACSVTDARDERSIRGNVQKSLEVQSCFAVGYRLATGQQRFAPATDATTDATDSNGNRIERISPAMMVNLGTSGELSTISPPQMTQTFDALLSYVVRAVAVGCPGTKATTVTGDYRNASFSSERSADNDAWPEIEQIQDWFSSSFNQPIYEELIRRAISAGYFGNLITPDEFIDRQHDLLPCNWQGGVQRWLNPVDEAKAAKARVSQGISSPQKEAHDYGTEFEQNLQESADAVAQATDAGLPQEYVNEMLGMQAAKEPAADNTQEASNGVGNAA